VDGFEKTTWKFANEKSNEEMKVALKESIMKLIQNTFGVYPEAQEWTDEGTKVDILSSFCCGSIQTDSGETRTRVQVKKKNIGKKTVNQSDERACVELERK